MSEHRDKIMKDYVQIILKQLLDAAQDGNISHCTWYRIINHGYCAYCDGTFGTDRCFYLANSEWGLR